MELAPTAPSPKTPNAIQPFSAAVTMDTSRIFLKCVMGIVSLLGEKRHFIVFYANPKALRAKSSLHMAGNRFPC